MNPVSWTQEKRGFYMSKLTYEDKINIYIDKKGGMSIGSLSSKYKVSKNIINYLTFLYLIGLNLMLQPILLHH